MDCEFNIDELINKISNITTEYDEYNELEENVNLRNTGFVEIKLTQSRYQRYIDGINIWEITELNIDARYIRDSIMNFIVEINVNEKNKDDVQWLNKCLETMKKIDNELKMLIDQIRERQGQDEDEEMSY